MTIKQSVISFYHKSKRVWHVLRKPTKEEFWTVSKVSAIGIAIIGVLGFLVTILMNVFI